MTYPTYKGQQVESVDYDRRGDTFSLIAPNGGVVAELKRHEYQSLPQLKSLRLTNGGHRRSHPKIHGSSVGQSYFTISPGTIVHSTFSSVTWYGADFAERPAIEDAGIRAGEITGHRTWRVHGDRLFSVWQSHVEWFPGMKMQGDVRHEYGVHAFKNEDAAKTYALSYSFRRGWISISFDSDGRMMVSEAQEETGDIFVFGTVAMWGEVVEHERGYRAEFAKIASLDSANANAGDGLLDRLRSRYGLDRAYS